MHHEGSRQFVLLSKALEAKIEAGRAVTVFECEHALIAQLVHAVKT